MPSASAIAFTARGIDTARHIAAALRGQGWEADVSAPEKLALSCDASEVDAARVGESVGEDVGASGTGASTASVAAGDASTSAASVGTAASAQVASAPSAHDTPAPATCGNALPVTPIASLSDWCASAFPARDALVFVSATGIAVRAIAKHLASKYTDPAVVCVDEQGRFAIPLVSGHVGGANELARAIARAIGATPVVTTATDGRGLFAVDEWARSQNLAIVEHDRAKAVSAALLAGEPVAFACDIAPYGSLAGTLPRGLTDKPCNLGVLVSFDADASPFATTLHLVPRRLVLGVGCRRNTPAETVRRVVSRVLMQAHISPQAVCTLSSVDVKSDEPALAELAHDHGWNLRFLSANQLNGVPGAFTASEFVRATVGTDNVCERAAAWPHGQVVVPKHAEDGVTVALGCEPFTLTFPEGDTA